MNEREVAALDQDLDALGQGHLIGTTAADRTDALNLLAMVRPADWPDRAAGQRVTEAVAARLDAQPRLDPAAAVRPLARRGENRARRWHFKQRRPAMRRAVVFVSAAAVALGAAITAVAIKGGPVLPWSTSVPPQVFHSRFTAEVLAGHSQPAGKDRALAGGWQLLSYLSEPGWRADDIGTPPDDLSCPTRSVCYMTAARPVPASGPGFLTTPRFNLLEVSRDGGARWTTLGLPSDISITTPLQCPASVTTCYAAGYDAGRVVLLATTDGGLSWSARPIPGPVDFADALACTTDGSCVGLFVDGGWAPGYYGRASNSTVLVTRDGGLTWSPGPPVPHGQLPDYLACSGTTCVLLDQLITEDNNQSVNGKGPLTIAPGSWAAWYSHDGGMTWQRGQHPGSTWVMNSNDTPQAGAIACSDRLHCWAAMSTQIGEPGIATAFAATSNGGITWVTQSLPVQRAQHFIPLAMSCPTALQCYAAGGDSAGPVVLTTRDGGAIWSPVNLPKTNTGNLQRSGVEPSIGLIACPAAGRCVAAPATWPSAHWIPIYSLGSS